MNSWSRKACPRPRAARWMRWLVATPKQVQDLKDDPQYARASQFHKEFNALFPNYVGSIGKFHVFKSTTQRQVNNSSSVPIPPGNTTSALARMAKCILRIAK